MNPLLQGGTATFAQPREQATAGLNHPVAEVQLAADQRLAQGTTQCDLGIGRQINHVLPDRRLGQANAEGRLLITGDEQADRTGCGEAAARAQGRLELADLNTVEIEQQRGIDVVERLLGSGEGTVTNHQKAIGLRLIQVTAEHQAQITAAAGQRQGITGGGRQETEGIPMAFELKVQRITQGEGDTAAHLQGLGGTVTAECEVKLKPIGGQHSGAAFKAQGLRTEARLLQGQLSGQQRTAARQVVGARGTDSSPQDGGNGDDQSQQ